MRWLWKMKREVKISPHHSVGEVFRRMAESEENARIIGEIVRCLRPMIVSIVRRAFKRYAEGHKVSEEFAEKEWAHFKKILEGML